MGMMGKPGCQSGILSTLLKKEEEMEVPPPK